MHIKHSATPCVTAIYEFSSKETDNTLIYIRYI